MQRLLALAFALLLFCGIAACQRDVVPPLVEVTELAPREVELGDRVEIRGSGFPQGRMARIALEGTLLRPGAAPVRGARIEATGSVESFDRIDFAFSDALEEKLCGHGDRAAHTTFRGDLVVAFASSTPGAPPLTGTLHNVALDVRPSGVGSATIDARNAEAASLLSFLGVTAGTASARGLPIDAVAPGSPAARAGLESGDVIVEADGVRVLAPTDLVPASARTMDVLVRRGTIEDTRTIALVGYASDRIPAEYVPAVLLVGLALAWLLVLAMPGPAVLGALELRAAAALRTTPTRVLARSLFGEGALALVTLLASVLVATFALGPHVVDADIDGPLLLVAALALLTASRIVAARGFLASLRAALVVLASGATIALAVAGVVVLEGAFQLGELVRVQGGAPWEWAAARQPAALVLALVHAGVLFALLHRREKASPPPRAVAVLERLGLFVACAVAVAVFFGGWRLPGAMHGSLGMQLLAGVLFVVKSWALAAGVRGAVALATPWPPRAARDFALKKLLPALLLGALVVFLTRRFAPNGAFELPAGVMVVTAALLFSARSALRVRDAMGRPEPHASPFL